MNTTTNTPSLTVLSTIIQAELIPAPVKRPSLISRILGR